MRTQEQRSGLTLSKQGKSRFSEDQLQIITQVEGLRTKRPLTAAKVDATPTQLEALQRFAAIHGRYWKCRLLEAWMKGSEVRLPDGGTLRQVRNDLGPLWLQAFTLAKP